MFMLDGGFKEDFHEIFEVAKLISCNDPLRRLSENLPKDHKDGGASLI
jgi:hypothetical protein